MSGILSALIGPVTGLLDKFIPDADTKVKLAHEIATMAENQHHDSLMAQIEINKVEAQSDKWWKAGARPFIMWTCGLALCNNYIIAPYVEYFGGGTITLDVEGLYPLMLGLLGLGTMRTVEKTKGVSRG